MKARKPRCNPEDLIGEVFEKDGVSLTVIGIHGRNSNAHDQFCYDCRCSCGNEVVMLRDYLKRKNHAYGCRSCVNQLASKKRKAGDLAPYIGRRFGHLVITEFSKPERTVSDSVCVCRCDCGGSMELQYRKLSVWESNRTPHCNECKVTRDGLVRKSDNTRVTYEINGKVEDLREYSDKDPFKGRMQCTELCNVCTLRQFNCCHDCKMYSDYTKCYKHCHKDYRTCGNCVGGKNV